MNAFRQYDDYPQQVGYPMHNEANVGFEGPGGSGGIEFWPTAPSLTGGYWNGTGYVRQLGYFDQQKNAAYNSFLNFHRRNYGRFLDDDGNEYQPPRRAA